MGSRKINDLGASTFLFSVICDRAHEEARLEMPTVRVVLKHPEHGDTQKISHEVEAHISTNNVLHIPWGGGDAIAEFQADAYLSWEYVEDAAGQPER